jgi:hypothetical protein
MPSKTIANSASLRKSRGETLAAQQRQAMKVFEEGEANGDESDRKNKNEKKKNEKRHKHKNKK